MENKFIKIEKSQKFSLFLILVLLIVSCKNAEKKDKIIPEKATTIKVEKRTENYTANGLQIVSPAEGAAVSSPIEIKGQAKGSWYFEAVFAVRLVDENNNVLSESYLSATEDWMTEDWVPFEGKLEFSASESDFGFLIFEKANPSGLPKHSLSDTLHLKFRN